MNLTVEQEKIINSRKKNLLVSASAGCGKTFTMVERIMSIISSKDAGIKDMLIVTFTNAVASEMKQEIYDKIQKQIIYDTSLESELNDLHSSNISTFHSFCQKIIKEFFYEINIDPTFAIAGEIEVNSFKNTAIDETIKKISLDSNYSEIMDIFSENRNDKNLKTNIISLYDYLITKPDYGSYIKDMISGSYNTNINDNKIIIYIKNDLINKMKHYNYELNLISESCGIPKSDKIIGYMNEFIKLSGKLAKCTDLDLMPLEIIYDPKLKRQPAIRKDLPNDEKEIKRTIGETVKEIKKTIVEYNKILVTRNKKLETLISESRLQIEVILKLFEEFKNQYTLIKKKNNTLDFNDLEHYAIKILENEDIKNEIKNRFKYIFIDEYQDTNKVQEKIIELVSSKNNLFLVGDLKQSIFKFRQCDPRIFMKRYKLYEKNNIFSEKIDLNKNFRSEKLILNFVNRLFDNLMNEETVGLNYKKNSRFKTGADYKEKKNNLPLVSINLINTTDDGHSNPTEIYSVMQDYKRPSKTDCSEREMEHILVGEKIKEFVGKPIYDSKIGGYRKIDYKDIAVITRTKKIIRELSYELLKQNIDINTKFNFDLGGTIEVGLVNSFLKLINNKNDDISMARVLNSYMYKLTINDLSTIREGFSKGFFYEAVLNYINNNNDIISDKLTKLVNDINEYNHKKSYMNISELVSDIIVEFGLHEYFAILPDGKNRVENLNFYISLCNNFPNDHDLSKHIKYLKEDQDSDTSPEIIYSTNPNSVKITTIHSSKGLEYPVVIFVNCSDNLNKYSQAKNIVYNDDLGIAIDIYDTKNRIKENNPIKDVIRLHSKKEEIQEEIRLLYVALTRAKNHLCIIGKYNKDVIKLTSSHKINNTSSYIDWIVGSLDHDIINKIKNGVKSLNYIKNEVNYTINLLSESDLINIDDGIKQNYVPSNQENEKLIDELNEVFNYKYKHQNSVDIVAKSSVSEILKIKYGDNDDRHYSIKKFNTREIDDLKDEDFSSIGVAYHEVMEKIKFDDIESDKIKKNIDSLLKNNEIDEKTLSLVDQEKIIKAVIQIKNLGGECAEYIKEQPFILNIKYNDLFKNSGVEDKIMVQGIIDLIIKTNNNVYIIDYKTGKIEDENEIRQTYKTQLKIYKKATETAMNIRVNNIYIYSFYLNKCINV